MIKNSQILSGNTYKIDSYSVRQYEERRVVDVVTVVDAPPKFAKTVLVHSPSLMADVRVPIKELKIMEMGDFIIHVGLRK